MARSNAIHLSGHAAVLVPATAPKRKAGAGE